MGASMIELRRGAMVLAGAAISAAVLCGCVRRTLTINTEPQGAMVSLNDEDVGATPVARDFTWYGDYDVVIRKKGFETLRTNVVVKAPWYQIAPIDFFADVLWPTWIHDQHHHAFTLEPRTAPTHDELVTRAVDLRTEALSDDR